MRNDNSKLSIWQWESFERIINGMNISFVDSPVINADKVDELSVLRNDDLQLEINISFDDYDSLKEEKVPVGTVTTHDTVTKVEGLGNVKVDLVGLYQVGNCTTVTNGQETFTAKYRVDEIKIKLREHCEEFWQCEWVANVNEQAIFSCSTEMTGQKHARVSFASNNDEIVFIESNHDLGRYSGRDCLLLELNGERVILGKVRNGDKLELVRGAGYVLYEGSKTEEERRKIRNCLSFILGNSLIYLGYSEFTKDEKLIAMYAVNGMTIQGQLLKNPSLPPTILSRSYEEVDADVASYALQKLYSNYDELNFQHAFWLYWHAVCSPFHAAASSWGGLIEFLQDTYLESSHTKLDNKLLAKAHWRELLSELREQIAALDADVTAKRILQNKINGLNVAPASIKSKRFIEALGILFGDVEERAWEERNRAAHGGVIPEGQYTNAIRINKVLKVIVHRVIIAMTGMSDFYIDYYSIEHPVRALVEAIPADTGELDSENIA